MAYLVDFHFGRLTDVLYIVSLPSRKKSQCDLWVESPVKVMRNLSGENILLICVFSHLFLINKNDVLECLWKLKLFPIDVSDETPTHWWNLKAWIRICLIRKLDHSEENTCVTTVHVFVCG